MNPLPLYCFSLLGLLGFIGFRIPDFTLQSLVLCLLLHLAGRRAQYSLGRGGGKISNEPTNIPKNKDVFLHYIARIFPPCLLLLLWPPPPLTSITAVRGPMFAPVLSTDTLRIASDRSNSSINVLSL